MLLPIAYNQMLLRQRVGALASADSSQTNLNQARFLQAQIQPNETIMPVPVQPGQLTWLSFSAAAPKSTEPSLGQLATQELDAAKPELTLALQERGFQMDEGKFLILSSGRKLFVVLPATSSQERLTAFKAALTESLKTLPVETYPKLRAFAEATPPAIVVEKEIRYRPA